MRDVLDQLATWWRHDEPAGPVGPVGPVGMATVIDTSRPATARPHRKTSWR